MKYFNFCLLLLFFCFLFFGCPLSGDGEGNPTPKPETPNPTPEEILNGTPVTTPEETPGDTQEPTPEETHGDTLEPTPEETLANTPVPTPDETPVENQTPSPEITPVPTPVYYTANIVVVNNDSEEYRLYIGTSDNLYNADTEIVDLNEGEIVIQSIPGSSMTDPYDLDLGTNPSLGKDWVMQYYDSFFEEWSIVICTPIQDADGYVFEGNESYTITIVSTANISIQMDM